MLLGEEMFIEIGCICTSSDTNNEEGLLAHEKIIPHLAKEISSVYGNKQASADILNIDWKEVLLPTSGKSALIASYAMGKIRSRGFGLDVGPICESISRSNQHTYIFCRAYNDFYLSDKLYIAGKCVSTSSADYPDLFESILRQIVNPQIQEE